RQLERAVSHGGRDGGTDGRTNCGAVAGTDAGSDARTTPAAFALCRCLRHLRGDGVVAGARRLVPAAARSDPVVWHARPDRRLHAAAAAAPDGAPRVQFPLPGPLPAPG